MKVLETILGTKCSLGSFDRHCVLFVEETGCERIQMCVGIVGVWWEKRMVVGGVGVVEGRKKIKSEED